MFYHMGVILLHPYAVFGDVGEGGTKDSRRWGDVSITKSVFSVRDC